MKCLVPGTTDIAPVGIEQAASTRSQGDGALASVQRHGPDQPLVSQVAQIVVAGVRRRIPRVAQVPLGHYPEGARCRESAALFAIDLVTVITVEDDLSFEAARELKTLHEHVSRMMMTLARIEVVRSIVPVVITVANVVLRLMVGRGTASQHDPMNLDVSRLVIAFPRVVPSRIGAAGHYNLLLLDRALSQRAHARFRWLAKRLCVAHGTAAIGDRMESVPFGSRAFLSTIVSPTTRLPMHPGTGHAFTGRLEADRSEGL
jgi:hypothetical protein